MWKRSLPWTFSRTSTEKAIVQEILYLSIDDIDTILARLASCQNSKTFAINRVVQTSLVNTLSGEMYHRSYSWLTRSHAVKCLEQIRAIRKFVKLDAAIHTSE